MDDRKLPLRHVTKFSDEQAKLFNACVRLVAHDLYLQVAFRDEAMEGSHHSWCSDGLSIDLTAMTECASSRRVGVEVTRDGKVIYRAGYEMTVMDDGVLCASGVETDDDDGWKEVVLAEAARLAEAQETEPL